MVISVPGLAITSKRAVETVPSAEKHNAARTGTRFHWMKHSQFHLKSIDKNHQSSGSERYLQLRL